MILEPPEADEAAGKGEERFVDLVAAVIADEQSLELVQPREGAFDPAVAAEPGAVIGAAASDFGCDAAPAELAPMAPGVVAAVGAQPVRSSAWPATLPRTAAHGQQAESTG